MHFGRDGLISTLRCIKERARKVFCDIPDRACFRRGSLVFSTVSAPLRAFPLDKVIWRALTLDYRGVATRSLDPMIGVFVFFACVLGQKPFFREEVSLNGSGKRRRSRKGGANFFACC